MRLTNKETPMEVAYSAQRGEQRMLWYEEERVPAFDSIKTGGGEGTTWAPAGRFSRKKVTTFQNFYVEKKKPVTRSPNIAYYTQAHTL
jgi:hypothetical protein